MCMRFVTCCVVQQKENVVQKGNVLRRPTALLPSKPVLAPGQPGTDTRSGQNAAATYRARETGRSRRTLSRGAPRVRRPAARLPAARRGWAPTATPRQSRCAAPALGGTGQSRKTPRKTGWELPHYPLRGDDRSSYVTGANISNFAFWPQMICLSALGGLW